MNRARPVLVVIAGGSATGKSTLARQLAAGLAQLDPVILAQDSYFRDFAEYDLEERERVRTANHPDAVNWPAFHAALDALLAGGRITHPAPGTRPAARGEAVRTLGPAELIIVEGLFGLWDERCRDRADLRIYTEVDEDERVLRRVQRDVTERGSTVERMVSWYRRDVRPNYRTYTVASRPHADLVVLTERHNQTAIRALCAAIEAIAQDPDARPGAGGAFD